jgi:hypothetical protein
MLHWISETVGQITNSLQGTVVPGGSLRFDFVIFLVAFFLVAFILISDRCRAFFAGIGRYVGRIFGR